MTTFFGVFTCVSRAGTRNVSSSGFRTSWATALLRVRGLLHKYDMYIIKCSGRYEYFETYEYLKDCCWTGTPMVFFRISTVDQTLREFLGLS